MDSLVTSDFGVGLSQLYAALAEADPLTGGVPIAASAAGVAAAFAGAPAAERGTYLLRALDECIAMLEVASRLADVYHARDTATRAGTTDDAAPVRARPAEARPAEALRAAYAAFSDAQPAYAPLYHYRNTLAAQFHQPARALPPTVTGTGTASDDQNM